MTKELLQQAHDALITSLAYVDATSAIADVQGALKAIEQALAQQEQPAPAPALTHLSDSELLEIGARYSTPQQFSRAFDEAGWLAAGREIEARNQHVIRVPEEKLQSDAATAPTKPALSDEQIIKIALSTLSANMSLKAGDLQKFARAIEAHCRGGATP